MDINKLVDEAISKYPDKIIEYKNGNNGLLGLFVGESMKMSRNKADVKGLMKIVKQKLNNI